jgi:hypothetical protein
MNSSPFLYITLRSQFGAIYSLQLEDIQPKRRLYDLFVITAVRPSNSAQHLLVQMTQIVPQSLAQG